MEAAHARMAAHVIAGSICRLFSGLSRPVERAYGLGNWTTSMSDHRKRPADANRRAVLVAVIEAPRAAKPSR
jgi:hypothetical protein